MECKSEWEGGRGERRVCPLFLSYVGECRSGDKWMERYRLGLWLGFCFHFSLSLFIKTKRNIFPFMILLIFIFCIFNDFFQFFGILCFLLFLWLFYIFTNFYLILLLFFIIFRPDEIGCWQCSINILWMMWCV